MLKFSVSLHNFTTPDEMYHKAASPVLGQPQVLAPRTECSGKPAAVWPMHSTNGTWP